MKFAALIPLVGFVCNLLLAIFVLSRGRNQAANRVYFFLGLAISVWNFGSFYLFLAKTHEDALFWARFLQFGVIFGPVLLFHLSLLVADIKVRDYIWGLYAFEAILALSNFTDFFIRDVRLLGTSGWYAVAGPGFYIFNGPWSLVFIAIFILVRKRGSMPALHRSRLDAMILAQGLLVVFGTNDILPIVGIDHYPFTNVLVYPYGSVSAVLYGMIVGYSVLQRQFLDIKMATSRLVAHAMRVGFMFFIGLTLLLVVTLFASDEFTTFSFWSGILVVLTSAIMASVFFPRLFGTGTETLERRILGDRFEYHDQLRTFIASIHWYSDLELLVNDLHELLTKSVCLRSYVIVLREETKRAFSIFKAFPEFTANEPPELENNSEIFSYFETTKADYLGLNIAYADAAPGSLKRRVRERLSAYRAEFCFALRADDQSFGLLLLGEKANSDPYTSTDLTLLTNLAKNLSLMINQIRLKNQILHNQEMDLLGRMSRGMAHDLNNLLTPIWTLLQLASEGIPTESLKEELLPVAYRNIKTMRADIREALFFSENLRPDLQLCRLDMIVRQAVEIVHGRLEKKNINVVVDAAGEVLAELDEVLIQRLIANILSNAADASPTGSTLRVELVKLLKT